LKLRAYEVLAKDRRSQFANAAESERAEEIREGLAAPDGRRPDAARPRVSANVSQLSKN
jgi:hypothetical protein